MTTPGEAVEAAAEVRETVTCDCGHAEHLHDPEAVPALCLTCGDDSRCGTTVHELMMLALHGHPEDLEQALRALAPTLMALGEQRVRERLAEVGPCANYCAPLTCLTAPSSESSRCDHCKAQVARVPASPTCAYDGEKGCPYGSAESGVCGCGAPERHTSFTEEVLRDPARQAERRANRAEADLAAAERQTGELVAELARQGSEVTRLRLALAAAEQRGAEKALRNLPVSLVEYVRASERAGVLIARDAQITTKHLSQMLCHGVGSLDTWVRVIHASRADRLAAQPGEGS